MDIQNSFNSQILQAMKTLVESNLNLTVGQQIAVTVTAINSTGITLKWGGQTLTVENQNQRATFTPYIGQNVTLQVAKISPELEFKLVTLDTQRYASTPPSPEKMNAMRLTLATAPLANRIDESLKSFVSHAQGQQPIEAKVVGLVGNKIQLQLFVDDHQGSPSGGKNMLISVERNQLQLLPTQTNEPLKVGQALTLAITKIGAMPEFKQLPSTVLPSQIQEERIAAFMKQLLPRHESPAVLLNQLHTDLPQLEIKNESLTTTLKQNAAALFDHLQPNEQLFNPQKLKHLIYSSGLFFEAKGAVTNVSKAPMPISTSIAQTPKPTTDLKMPLLNLLQHTSVTNELKQLTSTLLQNLLKQESAPTPEIAQLIDQNKGELHAQLLQLTRSENIPQSLKTLAVEILPNLKASNDQKINTPRLEIVTEPLDEPVMTDFKNDLFKLMHTLKQGIEQQNELALTETQVNGLQQLQTKTENALAKVVIDQLHSLPKEDGKQVWAFELPFLMGNQAETLKMEIQRDKANQSVDAQAQHWSVNLTLSPPKLGEVQCVISYQNGVVNTYFKNQQPQTTVLISQHLENLKQQLQKVGLMTGLMSAHNNFQPMKSAYSVGVKSFLNETV
ncbi:MAG: flagellar hook-length control protein FliK [Methylococcales bacterium]|nr:flagellar hook-length control protein FliK [Methylococcales bacterium]MDD5753221.1 flagellar hook-length control protein FliK [Methylococcales bacterium]